LKATIYESMFVLHPGEAAKDMDAAVQAASDMITKAGGNVLKIDKWDDRRLTYEIKRQKRGIYVLAYFESEGAVPNELQRLAGMADLVLRVQTVVSATGLPKEPEPEEVEETTEDGAAPASIPGEPSDKEVEAVMTAGATDQKQAEETPADTAGEEKVEEAVAEKVEEAAEEKVEEAAEEKKEE